MSVIAIKAKIYIILYIYGDFVANDSDVSKENKNSVYMLEKSMLGPPLVHTALEIIEYTRTW